MIMALAIKGILLTKRVNNKVLAISLKILILLALKEVRDLALGTKMMVFTMIHKQLEKMFN